MFRLDRTKFKAGKQADQKNDIQYWMRKTPIERLEAAWYLTCCAYGIDVENPPKMDKNVFKMGKRK